jgi:hypothetical protein
MLHRLTPHRLPPRLLMLDRPQTPAAPARRID